jgi:hypothetical protein
VPRASKKRFKVRKTARPFRKPKRLPPPGGIKMPKTKVTTVRKTPKGKVVSKGKKRNPTKKRGIKGKRGTKKGAKGEPGAKRSEAGKLEAEIAKRRGA